MKAGYRLRRVALRALALVSAAMLGLAAGAVWMVPMMALWRPLPWLALPLGALLGWAMRGWISRSPRFAGLLAALATVLAGLYASALLAAAQVAGAFGIGLMQSLRKSGPGLLWQLARLSWTPLELVLLVAGAAVAWAVAARRRR